MRSNLSSLLAYQGPLTRAPLVPPQHLEEKSEQCLELTVLFTGGESTAQALKQAAELARDLNAHIRLVVPQTVPYPLALESPPVLLEFSKHRFQALAALETIETRVEIWLCRDVNRMLDQILIPGSPIVIGGRKRWWRTREDRLARRLSRTGHEVVFATATHTQENGAHA